MTPLWCQLKVLSYDHAGCPVTEWYAEFSAEETIQFFSNKHKMASDVKKRNVPHVKQKWKESL